jgi:hypothetical protein
VATNPESILWPMLALMLWTLCVLLLLPLARYRAIRAGAVDWDDFAPGESARVPEPARRVKRALVNLLEVPVIFYALVLACLMALALAWAYVALRMAHTIGHLSYNRVTHRFIVFAASNGVLVAMLLRLAWRLK